jgi:hypothetical protein
VFFIMRILKHVHFDSASDTQKPEGKRPLGRPRRRWEDNINTLRTGDAELRLYITTVQGG